MIARICTFVSLISVSLLASDPSCPAYPESQRNLDRTIVLRDRLEQSFHQQMVRAGKPALKAQAAASAVPRRNLIDNYLFDAMQADDVPPAEPATDSEFLRRVYLDLTGRIPTVEQAEAFLKSEDTNRREALIESLLVSDAFVDRWTQFYASKFEVTSRYYNFISIQGRNRFFAYLQDFVRRDRSWAEVAREILTASGDSHELGPVNPLVRAIQQGDPMQDTWDTLTDRSTVTFLGMKTECISCHDGRRHLEEINLFLTPRLRSDFWKMSAFFSRTDIVTQIMDAYARQPRNLVTDRSTGGYTAVVNPSNPGPRPPRWGGPWTPQFMLTGERAANGNYRAEYARILTGDRQFARAAVNYLWAALFTRGIVDPPDAWDLRRIDPASPPPEPWTLQPSNPALMEALADEFIRSNYSIRHVLRLMANSSAYQLSADYNGTWRPEYERYFARKLTRRLGPEEVFDAMSRATMTEVPMVIEGLSQPVMFAMQLPDPSEPRGDFNVRNFLQTLGRGDWWNQPLNLKSTIIQALFMMNDNAVVFRTFSGRDGSRNTRVNYVLSRKMPLDEAVRHLFLATLSREPTAAELEAVNRNKRGTPDQWLADLQWALINKLDFLFNH